ncbi:MAG: hypothetical protein LCI00_19275 [Chloroflexi bacterium]|nr:hypothetical protein [Chloroflexota bacterium]MCC6894135.1 hypothetical protein [Anaerolineae bacterium]
MTERVEELRETVKNDDVEELAIHLRSLREWFATGDLEMIALLESLMDDTRLCIVDIPYYIGEIRYLAAQALRYERSKAVIKIPIERQIMHPMQVGEIAELARKYGINETRAFNKLKKLVELDVVPTINIKI